MFSYIFVGVAGGVVYSQKESVVWGSAIWLMVGGTPAGFAGAFVLQYISNIVVKLVLCEVLSCLALDIRNIAFSKTPPRNTHCSPDVYCRTAHLASRAVNPTSAFSICLSSHAHPLVRQGECHRRITSTPPLSLTTIAAAATTRPSRHTNTPGPCRGPGRCAGDVLRGILAVQDALRKARG